MDGCGKCIGQIVCPHFARLFLISSKALGRASFEICEGVRSLFAHNSVSPCLNEPGENRVNDMSESVEKTRNVCRVASEGNIPKWAAYSLAWARIRKAIEAEFPLEAVAIEESIFSDRLNSCRAGHGRPVRAKDGLKFIISEVKKFEEAKEAPFLKLLEKIESWYADRCRFLHGIVRSDLHDFEHCPRETSPKIPASSFMSLAQKCAERGEKLARQLCNWSKRQARKHKHNKVE